MSRGGISLIWQVIPVHDKYVDELDAFIVNKNNLKISRAIAARMRAVAIKYYSKTDENRVMRIAMSASFHCTRLVCKANVLSVLVPFFKLAYFTQHKWEPAWIATAVDLLRTEWKTRYKPTDEGGPNDSVSWLCVLRVS